MVKGVKRMNQNIEYTTVFNFDPYVYETLMSVVGSTLFVETTGMPVRGVLTDVKPDHIVMQDAMTQQQRYIRIAEMVSITPV